MKQANVLAKALGKNGKLLSSSLIIVGETWGRVRFNVITIISRAEARVYR